MRMPDRRIVLSGLAASTLLTPERLAELYGVGIETVRDGEDRVAFLPGAKPYLCASVTGTA